MRRLVLQHLPTGQVPAGLPDSGLAPRLRAADRLGEVAFHPPLRVLEGLPPHPPSHFGPPFGGRSNQPSFSATSATAARTRSALAGSDGPSSSFTGAG